MNREKKNSNTEIAKPAWEQFPKPNKNCQKKTKKISTKNELNSMEINCQIWLPKQKGELLRFLKQKQANKTKQNQTKQKKTKIKINPKPTP